VIAGAIDRNSIHFLPQEYFTDIPTGEKKVIDRLAQVQLAGQEIGFLVHVEAQASSKADFNRRQLTRRVGPLPDEVRSRLDRLSVPQLEQLARR
jgi:Domain of unknown function (DUF4351)